MDLQASISGTCPAAYAGTSGGVFLQAIMSLIAAHCGVNEEPWPKDRADEVLSDEGKTYDFIIVGAGTAGSIVAGRLAELFPTKTVLVVEAGGDPGLDSEVPSFLYFNQHTKADWEYKTTADQNSCLGFKHKKCYWSQGKGVGGSSSINAMLYVRGHPTDYDEWKRLGNYEWSYQNVVKYFERIEATFNITEITHENSLYEVIKNGWKELNYHHNDPNSYIGTKFVKLLVQNGRRLQIAKKYLKRRRNLFVMKNTHVDKIIINSESKVAVGVKLRRANGAPVYINSTEEIILSAGAIATPKILMLSGIGPKEELSKHNIECLKDLPVGKNLQDHILLPLFLSSNIYNKLDNDTFITSVLQYMLTRTGPLSTVGIIDLMGFLDFDESGRPQVQYHHTFFPHRDKFTLEPYLKVVQYKDEITRLILEANKRSLLLGIYPTLLDPQSRGEILLNNRDPKAPPFIAANYFSNREDIINLLRGIAFVQKLEQTPTFDMLDLKLKELRIAGCIGKSNDEYWICYMKHMASTIYHPVGTCKMGLQEDETSVVSEELLVHGIEKLRVVDASVMPTIPRANTVATVMMIAEKAVDFISDSQTLKDEL